MSCNYPHTGPDTDSRHYNDPATGHQQPGGGSHLSRRSLQLEERLTPGVRAFFVPIKYAVSVSNQTFHTGYFESDMRTPVPWKEGRKIENKKQLESTN